MACYDEIREIAFFGVIMGINYQVIVQFLSVIKLINPIEAN